MHKANEMIKPNKDGTPGYKLTEEQNKIVLNIAAYFFGGETGYDRSKGLLLTGKIGCGKTFVFKIIQNIINSRLPYGSPKQLLFNSCKSIETIFNTEGDGGLTRFKDEGERIFDDFGWEQEARHYANKKEVMETVLAARYDKYCFGANHVRTHLSTNLGRQEIIDRYGERLYNRFIQMFNIIHFPGESKRSEGQLNIDAPNYFEQEKPSEPSEETKKELKEKYYQTCFADPYNRFVSLGVLPMDEVNRYDFFKLFYGAGVIVVTDKDKEIYKAEAIGKLLPEWSDKRYSEPKKYGRLLSALDSLNFGQKMSNPIEFTKEDLAEVNRSIKNLSCALFFRDWLKKQIAEKKTAEELLNLIR